MEEKLEKWLAQIGLEDLAATFAENDIEYDILSELSEEDLKDMGLSLGRRRKLLKEIRVLTDTPADTSLINDAKLDADPIDIAERRQLTVMFCDLVGSTALSERMDPEDLRDLLRRYQATCTAAVERFGGHVAKFLGDGILIYFGYPEAHEDDAARAIRAGFALLNGIETLNADLQNKYSEIVAVRMGVHTGLVVTGALGDGAAREEQAIVGETPNIAARLEGLAGSGEIVVGPLTWQLTKSAFEFEDLGSHSIKGISRGLDIYRAVGARQDTGTQQHAAQMVGRARELALMTQACEESLAGNGQLVFVSAEAGIGKSRLIDQFAEHIGQQGSPIWRYQCSPFYIDSAFYPVISQLERVAGIRADDIDIEKQTKLKTCLASMGQNDPTTLSLMASLLSIPLSDDYPALNLTPQRQSQLVLQAFVAMVMAQAEQQPLTLLFEDIHWMDPSSLSFIDGLMMQMGAAPLLVVLTSRPEFDNRWQGFQNATALALSRLDRNDTFALIDNVAGAGALPDEIKAAIAERTDGVPLFITELTKSIVESRRISTSSGDTDTSLAIPATLQDSLMARLDRLGPAKEVAQIGSIIGRDFEFDILARLMAQNLALLEQHLDQLVQAELLQYQHSTDQRRYIFHHALVQDAAYNSLLRSRRQAMHLRIAEIMEADYPDLVTRQPELLAQHFDNAGVVDRAVPHWLAAGERAVRQFANVEALSHYGRGLAAVRRFEDTGKALELELEILNIMGPISLMTNGWGASETKEIYERAVTLSAEVQDLDQAFSANWGNWLYQYASGNVSTAYHLVDDLFALADRRPDDIDLRLQANHAGWGNCSWSGNFGLALEYMEEGLRLYDVDRHRDHANKYGGHDAKVCGATQGAIGKWCLGYPDQADRLMQQGVDHARSLEHPSSVGHGLMMHALLLELKGDADNFNTTVEELRVLATDQALGVYAVYTSLVGNRFLLDVEQAKIALDQFDEIFETSMKVGVRLMDNNYLSTRAHLLRLVKRPQEAMDVYDRALESSQTMGAHMWTPEIIRKKGDLIFEDFDDRVQAIQYYKEAMHVARESNCRMFELRTATSLASVSESADEIKDALARLEPVYKSFTEGFETPEYKAAQTELEKLKALTS